MKRNHKKFHEVVISDDPERRRRVAMENNDLFHVMLIERDWHGTEIYRRDQLLIVGSVRH